MKQNTVRNSLHVENLCFICKIMCLSVLIERAEKCSSYIQQENFSKGPSLSVASWRSNLDSLYLNIYSILQKMLSNNYNRNKTHVRGRSDSPLTQIKQALYKSSMLALLYNPRLQDAVLEPHTAGFMYNNHLCFFFFFCTFSPILNPSSA